MMAGNLLKRMFNFLRQFLGEEKIFPSERKKEKRPVLTLNIGVDYGTSTTKVAVRVAGPDWCYPIPLRKDKNPFVSYVLPSTIIIRNGALVFGMGEGEFEGGDEIIRSLKVCLTCNPENRNCEPDKTVDPRVDCTRKVFTLESGEMSIEAGSSLFIAEVLRRVHGVLEANFPVDKYEKKISYVMAAPVASIDDVTVLESFERVASAAISMNDQPHEDGSWRKHVAATNRQLLDSDISRTRFQIRPEAIAAVVPLLVHKAMSLKDGMYTVVDVGAGTTDASYFWLTRQSGNPRVEIYSVSNRVLGGDDLDRDILELVDDNVDQNPNERARWLQEIRLRKRDLHPYLDMTGRAQQTNLNAGITLLVNGREHFLKLIDVHGIMLKHAHSVREVMTEACARGYPMAPTIDRWTKQKSFFIGGGTQLKYVQEVLGWGPTNINFVDVDFQQLPLPGGGWTRLPKIPGEFPTELDHLFQVAKGLSYHPMSLPEITLPSHAPVIILLGRDDEDEDNGDNGPKGGPFDDTDWWREQD